MVARLVFDSAIHLPTSLERVRWAWVGCWFGWPQYKRLFLFLLVSLAVKSHYWGGHGPWSESQLVQWSTGRPEMLESSWA